MSKLALNLPGGEQITESLKDIAPNVFSNYRLDRLNPSRGQPTTPGDILNLAMPFIFVIAGLILFFMFIFGGFTIFISTGNPEKIKKGQGMIINALIGFTIIFAAYWIIQLLEITLGVNLLNVGSRPIPTPFHTLPSPI